MSPRRRPPLSEGSPRRHGDTEAGRHLDVRCEVPGCALHPPVVQGGQGRDGDEVTGAGLAVGVAAGLWIGAAVWFVVQAI